MDSFVKIPNYYVSKGVSARERVMGVRERVMSGGVGGVGVRTVYVVRNNDVA